MKAVIITQARYGSTRLKGKILREVQGESLLAIHVRRLLRSKLASKVIVATTDEPEAEAIVREALKEGASAFRGSINDVLDRFHSAIEGSDFDTVVRVTSDCPLNDSRIIDEILTKFWKIKPDYMSNSIEPTFADGLDVEVFSREAFNRAWKEATLPFDREHVTPFIYDKNNGFRLESFRKNIDDSSLRITLDYEEDFQVIKTLLEALGPDQPWEDYITFLKDHPELQVNRTRNETTIGKR